LIHADKVVSNVSVNIMNFNVFGEKRRYIQLGNVVWKNDADKDLIPISWVSGAIGYSVGYLLKNSRCKYVAG